MSDEEKAVEEAVEEEETPESSEEEALTDAQIAQALGVDEEYLAAVKPEIQNLKGFYAKVNKRNQDLVERQKELEAKGAKPVEQDEDDIDLDPQAQKVLRKFIQREFKPLLESIESERKESALAVMDDFVSEHRDVPPDTIYDSMEELGLWQAATTPTKLKKALSTAYKHAKTNASDPEAEIARRVAEELKKLEKSGEEVVEVKGKRSGVPTGTKTLGQIVTDEDIPWFERFKAFDQTED